MKIRVRDINIQSRTLEIIERANGIIKEYQDAGHPMTLRQLYYQLVARGYIENSDKNYKNIGNHIGNGRLAGLIDWDAIEDRTRKHRTISCWETPAELVRDAASSYHRDLWEGQRYYVEVWVEKDALIGIVEQAARNSDCTCLSGRGFVSLSAIWAAAQRFRAKNRQGMECVILYLGDHDPSGMAMPISINKHLKTFGAAVDLRRIALTMAQIQEYKPPPYPAKESDTRYKSYVSRYGNDSWELDALAPDVLDDLITRSIKMNLDKKLYDACFEQQEAERAQITALQAYLEAGE